MAAQLRILFIDDESASTENARHAVQQGIQGCSCESCGFDDAKSQLSAFQPDVVVLDLFDGNPADDVISGSQTCAFVWKERFCPIVVYSARPDALDNDLYAEHPFIERVQKGRGSPSRVLDKVRDFAPNIDAVKKVHAEISAHASVAMRDTARDIFHTWSDNPEAKIDALTRAVRRRIAASIDATRAEGNLAPWEQYLFPPISEDLTLGDLLKECSSDPNDASSYFLLLTPSCDLVTTPSRQPKVRNVLLARCCQMRDALASVGMQNISQEKLQKRLPGSLSRGFSEGYLPLPALPGRFPAMAADLRDLKLVPLRDIDASGCGSPTESRHARVASVDSPFREMIAWAYISLAGRPGLPERDFQKWATDILTRTAEE